MDLSQLIETCAIDTHPKTVMAVIRVESAGNYLAIGVNGNLKLRKAQNPKDAAQLAQYAISKGYSVDMGLMQINSNNARRFGISLEEVFNPCTNIRLGTKILSNNYSNAVDYQGEGQGALKAALSAYNTGSMTKGFRNGYVGKYYKRANQRLNIAKVNLVYDFRESVVAPPTPEAVPSKQESPKAKVTYASPYDVSSLVFSRSN